jgi:hypothetical protein
MTLRDELEQDKPEPSTSEAWATVSPDGGEFATGTLPEPLTGDWTSVLRGFGLDPDVFEVADDTVRMSKWQSSKRLENGDRDLIWLYAYKAKFRRRTLPVLGDADLLAFRATVGKWKPITYKQKTSDATPSTFVVCWADQQLGKSAGGGVAATVERVLASFDATVARVVELRKIGRNIEGIAVVNMGDPIEGCDGNYASQLFTVELNMRQQLLLALDLWCKGLVTFAQLSERVQFISVLCNHGEWMRRGGKAVTGDSDNAGGFLADATKRILENQFATSNIDWVIPQDEMTVCSVLSDVKVAFAHGHKMSGKPLEWLRGQSIRILREEGREPDLWVTAHYHHLNIVDWGAFTQIQCPSNDGGSKWFEDATGKWSTAGTLTMLVGKHDARNWSDLAVL